MIYRTKSAELKGTDFKEVHNYAISCYKKIKNKSKRRAYIRSAYFKKDKIFIDLFWEHLFSKENWKDRTRRLKYFPAAIELINKNTFDPQSKENPNKNGEILHRFKGKTPTGKIFFVQIKENKRNGQKFFISVFPEN